MMNSSNVLVLDIETTGLDPWKDEILLVGLYDGKKYVCCRTKEELQGRLPYVETGARPDLVCHNAQFDIKFLEIKGWWKPDGRVIHDTKIMASLQPNKVHKNFITQYEQDRKALNKEDKKRKLKKASPNSLKVLAPYYLQVPRFWETGDYNDEEYNKKDCQYTYELFYTLGVRLDTDAWRFYENMLEWSEMIMSMETKGIQLSEHAMKQVEAEYVKKEETLRDRLKELWALDMEAYREHRASWAEQKLEKIAPFNFASSVQMRWLLRDRFGLDIKDSEGDETTGKSVLSRLAAEGRKDIQTFLKWRKAKKILTSYLPSYRELAHENTLHPSFNLTGTRTGRTSSSGPNLQQVPDTLYKVFQPRPGHKFVKFDLSGIEAALIALYSGDKTIFDLLAAGESIHDHNTKLLFDLACPVDQVSKLFPRERKCVKTIGFACFYGAGAKRIKDTFSEKGFPLTKQEASRKLSLLKNNYMRAFEFHKEITEVFSSGQTVINLFGRPVNIQPWENAYMQGFNTLIQSSASDLNIEACFRYWKAGGNPLLVIHDCILAEEPAEVAEDRAQLMISCMTNWKLKSEQGNIELRVEGGVSDVWE